MKSLVLWGGIAIASISFRPDIEKERYGYFLVACCVVGAITGIIDAIRKHRGY